MNTLEALISLTALFAFFAAMLTAVSAQKENIFFAQGSMKAKSETLLCAEIIDSIYANGIDSYIGEIGCEFEENIAASTSSGCKKETETIAQTENGFGLAVKTFGHYIE